MSRLDVRTRVASDMRHVDLPDFFERELPGLVGERAASVLPGVRAFDPQPIGVVTDSGAWVLTLRDESLAVARDGSVATSIRLSDADFGDFVNDLTTLTMLRNLERLRIETGSIDGVAAWDTVLRALLDNRPVHVPGQIEMKDSGGRPLDVHRAFTPDDSDDEMANFLIEAGFLHLSGWLDPTLMAEVAGDMARELRVATPDDGSWWATMKDQTRQPVRLVNFEARSAATASLSQSEVFARLCRLTDDGYRPTESVEALNKPLGVVAGTSDIAWHHDCALGMHSYNCCALVVGISVTDGGAGSGQLGVVPGSHRALMPKNRFDHRSGLQSLTISTRSGDITVHCSCLLHTAFPPTKFERKVMYTSLKLPVIDAGVERENTAAWERRAEVQKVMGKSAV